MHVVTANELESVNADRERWYEPWAQVAICEWRVLELRMVQELCKIFEKLHFSSFIFFYNYFNLGIYSGFEVIGSPGVQPV